MTTEYARRGQVAGKTLKYQNFATVRGEIRRNNPDGVSLDPYFPVQQNSTLQMRFDGTHSVEAQFASMNLSVYAIVTALNSAIGAYGKAYELDGVIHLQTATEGSSGSVEVMGGTAAEVLGFRSSLGVIAKGGDLEVAVEGRIQNPYRTSFPTRGENLGFDTILRAFGRLSTNLDVVHDEVVREFLSFNEITADSQTLISNDKLGVIPVADVALSIFTAGGGELSRLSTPEELATYFQVIDTQTKVRSFHKVVSVVIGTVAGDPPYADAASLQANGNVLGRSFLRVGPTNIVAIHDGCIVQIAVDASSVQPGDKAVIAGANVSTIPWDNRGTWIVDEVIGTNYVKLRAMSAAERLLESVADPLSDPLVALNPDKGQAQDYGTVAFYSGSALNGVKFVISPALPASAVASGRYKIRAATRTPRRQLVPAKAALGEGTRFWTTADGGPNIVVGSPTLSLGPSGVTVSGFPMRLNGKLEQIPETTISIASMVGAPVYVYFDEALKQVLATTTAFGTVSDLQRKLLGIVDAAQSEVQNVTPVFYPTNPQSVTVGATGMFQSLEAAIAYVSAYLNGSYQTPGASYRAEILLLGDTYADVDITLQQTGIQIRGITPNTKIAHRGGQSGAHFLLNGQTLYLANLTVDSLTDISDDNGSEILQNVAASDSVVVHSEPGLTQIYSRSLHRLSYSFEGAPLLTLSTDGVLGVPGATVGVLGDSSHGGAYLEDHSGDGSLVLESVGSSDRRLTATDLSFIVGGPAADADSRHTHGAVLNHIAATTGAHAASAVSVVQQNGVSGANVQAALEAAANRLITRYSVAGITLTGSFAEIPDLTIADGLIVKGGQYLIELDFHMYCSVEQGTMQIELFTDGGGGADPSNDFSIQFGSGGPGFQYASGLQYDFSIHATTDYIKIQWGAKMPSPGGAMAVRIKAREVGAGAAVDLTQLALRCTKMS